MIFSFLFNVPYQGLLSFGVTFSNPSYTSFNFSDCESVRSSSITISVLVDRTGIWNILQVKGIHFLVAISWRSLNTQLQSLSKLIVHTIRLPEAYPSLTLVCKTLLLYNKRILSCAISGGQSHLHPCEYASTLDVKNIVFSILAHTIQNACKIMLVTGQAKIAYQQKSLTSLVVV